jgi:hypothetical protein
MTSLIYKTGLCVSYWILLYVVVKFITYPDLTDIDCALFASVLLLLSYIAYYTSIKYDKYENMRNIDMSKNNIDFVKPSSFENSSSIEKPLSIENKKIIHDETSLIPSTMNHNIIKNTNDNYEHINDLGNYQHIHVEKHIDTQPRNHIMNVEHNIETANEPKKYIQEFTHIPKFNTFNNKHNDDDDKNKIILTSNMFAGNENPEQKARNENISRKDISNHMIYSDYNRFPPNKYENDYEYGYSYVPPKDWYPIPVHPPRCFGNEFCEVQGVYENTTLDLKEWAQTQKILPPDNINTAFIINELNSK